MMRRLPSLHSAARRWGALYGHVRRPRVDEQVERPAGVGVQPSQDRVDRVAAASNHRVGHAAEQEPVVEDEGGHLVALAREPALHGLGPRLPVRCPSRARRGGADSGRSRSTSSRATCAAPRRCTGRSARRPPPARRSSGCGHGVRRSTRHGRPGERRRPRRPCSRKPLRHPRDSLSQQRACATPSPGRSSTSCPPRRARRGRGRSGCRAGSARGLEVDDAVSAPEGGPRGVAPARVVRDARHRPHPRALAHPVAHGRGAGRALDGDHRRRVVEHHGVRGS